MPGYELVLKTKLVRTDGNNGQICQTINANDNVADADSDALWAEFDALESVLV